MKFNCRKLEGLLIQKRARKWDRIIKWHRVFAWWPVEVKYGDCRWLEYVERKNVRVYDPFYYERFVTDGVSRCVQWEYRDCENIEGRE